MAKLERTLSGDFDALLDNLHSGILNGSASASWVDSSDYEEANVRCAVRVFERYSLIGGARVSLTLTLVGEGERLFLSAITAGGSRTPFPVAKALGEDSFLDRVGALLEAYEAGRDKDVSI